MRTKLFRNILTTSLLASGLGLAQQYPAPQYPPPQPEPQQQQYPAQQQQPYPQQQYPPQQGQYPQQPVYNQPPPVESPQQLQQLVAPIALYPDGLLAQMLTASTYSDQLPEAAGWANQHAYIHGPQLADAIRADNLQFAPSVMALLPFPSTLSYLAQNMGWTQQLGNAVLAQRPDVMDAVQFMRHQAYQYGYLRDPQFSQYERINVAGPAIEIMPANPGFYYIPYYNPAIVYAPLRPHYGAGAVFSFGGGIQLGAAFAPWGWGGVGFGWGAHSIVIDNHPWDRRWNNRTEYVHPYAQPYRAMSPRVEDHHYGRPREERREEHRDEHHDR